MSSTSTTPTGKQLPTPHLDATEKALDQITTSAAKHDESPKSQIHTPSHEEKSHSWMRSIFPYNSLQEFESAWHLGNYVLDRQTGEKSFEEMSIYVRLGMHLLYYGSEQEKALHWKRTQAMLKEQSVKMGREYDSKESVAHIGPFIESFGLGDSLKELKV